MTRRAWLSIGIVAAVLVAILVLAAGALASAAVYPPGTVTLPTRVASAFGLGYAVAALTPTVLVVGHVFDPVATVAALLIVTAALTIFSAMVRAPLLGLADFNKTPNPSKAPWYFLGLQELLTMFHPMIAGVTIPGMGLFLLMVAPFVDKNPSNKPKDRKFAISIFTLFVMLWAVLVIIGSFFRGPGFNFVAPWTQGLFFEL